MEHFTRIFDKRRYIDFFVFSLFFVLFHIGVRGSVVKSYHIGALNFYPIFIPLFGGKISGVSVQDMLLRLPFLTPETNFPGQKRGKKLSLCASSYRRIFITPGPKFKEFDEVKSANIQGC